MDNQTVISIISVVVDTIAVIVSVWSCIIAKEANKKADEAVKITQAYKNEISQKGNNNLANTGSMSGNMIGVQNVNK
ncbi:MAG: hypothetical protein IJH12_04790 [Clostridia bacterium]|nr:hypothetical protein [Clostridia bacterium]